ncbi:MAG TPA: glycosyl hydrolase family 28 protein [Paludibacteraceae bacterium]|nr:glycosyl hydrolase family 28 protein [Paludibacteraceae bacterium]
MKTTKQIILLICLTFIFHSFLKSENYLNLRETLNAQLGNKKIIIPKGKYILNLSAGPYLFSGLKDVTIEGNGSEIICDKQTRAFTFNLCENIIIKNLCIDYQPLCFTQGRIVSISEDKMQWDIKILPGYPVKNVSNRKLQLFDPETLELKKNFYTIYENNFTLIPIGTYSDSTFRIIKKKPMYPALENIGDLVVLDVFADGNTLPHTIYLGSCKNIHFENVTIYGSNSFSFFETDCENNSYHYCKIIRKKNDPNVGFPRLRSGNADGIHSKHATIGPTIVNCRIEHNGDDCIAINGRFYPVYKIDEANGYVYLLQNETASKIQVNDSLTIVDNNGFVKNLARCVSLKNASPTTIEIENCVAKFKKGIHGADSYNKGVQIKLSKWITNLKVGDLIYSKQRTGNHFKVENDTVGFTRARGILIKASDGYIKNNIVENCELAGIVLAPEFFWMEAGCSSNIEICNNEIKNCLFTASNPGIAQPGALTVISINGAGNISEYGVFSNINIHDNIIQGCPRSSVVLTSINKCSFYRNMIEPNENLVRQHGSTYGISNTVDVWTSNITELNTSSIYLPKLPQITILKKDPILVIRNEIETHVPLKLCLYNLSGTMVWNAMLYEETYLPLTDIPQGVYVLTMNGKTHQYMQKIIL